MEKIKFYDVPNPKKLGNRVFEFLDHYDNILPQLLEIKKLEEKYPFFRAVNPGIKYNGQILEAYTRFNLNLRASTGHNEKNGNIIVDFNGGRMDLFCTETKKSMKIEAQEKIYCDPELGYHFIKQYFFQNKREFVKEVITKNYEAKYKDRSPEQIEDIINRETKIVFDQQDDINKYILKFGKDESQDMLIFDDHDGKHTAFRGWTGGYDPQYPNPLNRQYAKLKGKWISGGFNSLEKRINTLKTLFDELVELSQFDYVEQIIPVKPLPNYKSIYAGLTKLEYYDDMMKVGKELSRKLKISNKYDINIGMDGENNPEIKYVNEDNRIMFKTEFLQSKGIIGNTALHIPKEFSKRKRDNRKLGIWTYNQDMSIYSGKNSNELDEILKKNNFNMISITNDFKTLEEIPKSLKYCLDTLI